METLERIKKPHVNKFQISDFRLQILNSAFRIPKSEMAMKPIIEILDHCSACGACVEICPVFCLGLNLGSLEIVNEEVCFGCRKCEDVCPEEAIRIKGIVP